MSDIASIKIALRDYVQQKQREYFEDEKSNAYSNVKHIARQILPSSKQQQMQLEKLYKKINLLLELQQYLETKESERVRIQIVKAILVTKVLQELGKKK